MEVGRTLYQNFWVYGIVLLASGMLNSCTQKGAHTQANHTENTASTEEPAHVSQTTADVSKIIPPLEYQTIRFDAQEGLVFKAKGSGTKVFIPPNGLVDKNGKTVFGKVKLQYREAFDAPGIMLAGLNMEVDPSTVPLTKKHGKRHLLQTAGMCEVRVFQNNNDVFIKKGYNVTIDMFSDVKGEGYDYYVYDTLQNKWVFKAANLRAQCNHYHLKPTSYLEKEQEVTQTVPPLMPNKAVSNKPTLGFDIAYNHLPELKNFTHLQWQFAGTDPKMDPENQSWVYKHIWQDLQLAPHDATKGLYTLTLKSATKNFSTIITPVVDAKDYAATRATYQALQTEFAAYEQNAAKEAAQALAESQTKDTFMRTIKATEFGWHNCDHYFVPTAPLEVNAQYTLPSKYGIEYAKVYVLYDGQSRSLQELKGKQAQELLLSKRLKQGIVALLPDNQVAVCSDKEIQAQLKNVKGNSGQATFELKTLDHKINSSADLYTAVGWEQR